MKKMKKILICFMFSGILFSCTTHQDTADNLENMLPFPQNLTVSEPQIEMVEVRDENGVIIAIQPTVTLIANAEGAAYYGLQTSAQDVSPVNSTNGTLKAVYPSGGTFESIVFAQGFQGITQTIVQVVIPEVPDIPLPEIDISDYYTFKSGDLNISSQGFITGLRVILPNNKVIIPNQIDGITIRGIGDEAFRGAGITFIDFRFVADGFVIGNASFRSSRLEYLRITKNIASIGSSSFRQSNSLAAVDFESRNELMTAIGDAAFRDCRSLQKFVVPRFILRLERSIFRGCNSLNSFSFQDRTKINFIGDNTFFDVNINVPLPFPNYDNFAHWVDENGNILNPGAPIGSAEYTAVFN